MKSLIEEATSVEKAIEKAWTRAGKPHTFSVKIFEEPETNFFGFLTKKSAKVGIFFDEKHVQQSVEDKGAKNPSVNTNFSPRPGQRNEERPHHRNTQHQRPRRDRNQQDGRRSFENNERRSENGEFQERRPRPERTNHTQQQEAMHNEAVTEQRQERPEQRERREHNGNREQRFDRNRRPNNRRPQQERRSQERPTSDTQPEQKASQSETQAPVFEFTTPSSTAGVKKNLRASSRRYSAKKETPTDGSSENQ